jgi:hypothetical protein
MKYFDKETEELMEESAVQELYAWFSKQPWYTESYETFLQRFESLEETV